MPTDKPIFIEIGEHVWWLNQDSRGGIWINGREKLDGDPQPNGEGQSSASTPAPGGETTAAPAAEGAPSPAPATEVAPALVAEPVAPAQAPVTEFVAPVSAIPPPPAPANVLTGVRLLLKETKTGGYAKKLDRVAEDLSMSPEDLLTSLLNAGLVVPEKAREKPVFVEHAGEIFWFNRNAKEELWINAKASKFTSGNEAEGDKKAGSRRPRPKKKTD